MNKALLYITFAIISTIVNLSFQYLSFYIYNGFLDIYIAMIVGTGSGLIVKYILDKKYIFFHKPIDKKDDSKKFLLYSFMGLFTTVIFWAFELGFDKFIKSENGKYLGAIIGLSIGYLAKYFLDKRFVFIHKKED